MEKIKIRSFTGRTLTLYEDTLILRDGKNEKTIPLSQVISIDFRAAKSKWTPGIFNITINGSPDSLLMLTPFLASGGNNVIKYGHIYECDQDAHRIRDYIIDFQKKAQQREVSTPSVSEEIRQLKDLVNDGIITQEEFEAKKKQLLNL